MNKFGGEGVKGGVFNAPIEGGFIKEVGCVKYKFTIIFRDAIKEYVGGEFGVIIFTEEIEEGIMGEEDRIEGGIGE